MWRPHGGGIRGSGGASCSEDTWRMSWMNLKLCTLSHTVVLLVFLEIFNNRGVTIYIEKRVYEGQEAAYYTFYNGFLLVPDARHCTKFFRCVVFRSLKCTTQDKFHTAWFTCNESSAWIELVFRCHMFKLLHNRSSTRRCLYLSFGEISANTQLQVLSVYRGWSRRHARSSTNLSSLCTSKYRTLFQVHTFWLFQIYFGIYVHRHCFILLSKARFVVNILRPEKLHFLNTLWLYIY